MNWKTTLSGTLAAIVATLTVLAALPYSLGEIAEIFPDEWKPKIVTVGLLATLVLRIINAIQTQDAGKTIESNPAVTGQTPVAPATETDTGVRTGGDGQAAAGKTGDR